eukprot:764581-Hanusia_phi.AAC.4
MSCAHSSPHAQLTTRTAHHRHAARKGSLFLEGFIFSTVLHRTYSCETSTLIDARHSLRSKAMRSASAFWRVCSRISCMSLSRSVASSRNPCASRASDSNSALSPLALASGVAATIRRARP